jgi:glycosyltransferase involved in cell wall biosynthesis
MVERRVGEPFSAAPGASLGRIAVLIPCLNEELTVAKVVGDFRERLPAASIEVFDNNSEDRTAEVARQAGAQVHVERRRGKGYVVQAMFRQVDADYYVLVDGDDTYPAEQVQSLLQPVIEGRADMVIGSRMGKGSASEFRFVNWMGNVLFRAVTNLLFGARLTDLLSGYRCMSRALVKSLPLFERGFGIEAEITIKALERGFHLVEIPVGLKARREGSSSKIRVLRDGLTIIGTIGSLFRDYKPFTFFGGLGLIVLALTGISIFWIARTWPGLSTTDASLLIVLNGLALVGILLIAVGLILHTLNRRFQEMEYFERLPREESSREK